MSDFLTWLYPPTLELHCADQLESCRIRIKLYHDHHYNGSPCHIYRHHHHHPHHHHHHHHNHVDLLTRSSIKSPTSPRTCSAASREQSDSWQSSASSSSWWSSSSSSSREQSDYWKSSSCTGCPQKISFWIAGISTSSLCQLAAHYVTEEIQAGTNYHCQGKVSRKKLLVFWILSKWGGGGPAQIFCHLGQ